MSTRLSFRVLSNATFDEMGELRFLVSATFRTAAAALAYRATLTGQTAISVSRGGL